jgi:hypothetical protein
VPINKLLSDGYEIKAAYTVTGATGGVPRAGASDLKPSRFEINSVQIHYMILQKGASAYGCTDEGAKYGNQLRCYPVLDYEEK